MCAKVVYLVFVKRMTWCVPSLDHFYAKTGPNLISIYIRFKKLVMVSKNVKNILNLIK